jgi:DNA-binding MarR family transcriptional regulator
MLVPADLVADPDSDPDSDSDSVADRVDVTAFERLTQALVDITAHSLDALGECPVTVSQFRLLHALEGLGRVPSSTLAAALGTAASSVTRLVDRLVAIGLVARGTAEHSRSIVTVEATEAGREVVRAVLARRRELLATVLDGLAEAERGEAAATAERLARLAGQVAPTSRSAW